MADRIRVGDVVRLTLDPRVEGAKCAPAMGVIDRSDRNPAIGAEPPDVLCAYYLGGRIISAWLPVASLTVLHAGVFWAPATATDGDASDETGG